MDARTPRCVYPTARLYPFTERLRSLRTDFLGILSAVLLAACGGGDNVSYQWSAETSSDPDWVLLSADLDEDGHGDLLAVPRASAGPAVAWRGTPTGLVSAPALAEGEAARSIRSDVARRTEADLRAGEGLHQAGTTVTGAGRYPYALIERTEADDGDASPTIDALLPEEGTPGSLLGIRGRALAGAEADTQVFFGTAATTPLFAVPGFVLCEVPDTATAGAVEVQVGVGAERSNVATYLVLDPAQPTIESVWPDPLVRGSWFVLKGNDLGTPRNVVRVRIGSVDATQVLALGTRLLAQVPEAAASGDLIVTVDGVDSAAFAVTVAEDHAEPRLDRAVPTAASPGSIVRLEGRHFLALGDRLRVTLGGTEAALFSVTPEALYAIVPPGAQDGDWIVEVGTRRSAGLAFTVLQRGDPQIDSLSPSTIQSGDRITITGRDLSDLSAWSPGSLPPWPRPFGDVEVRFGDVRAWFFLPTEDGLVLRVPPGVRSSGTLTVRVGTRPAASVAFEVE